MAKTVTSLTGTAKDAFLRRAVAKAAPDLDPKLVARLAASLEREVSRLWVKTATGDAAIEAELSRESAGRPKAAPVLRRPTASATAAPPAPVTASAEFDPYSPNVIVVLRKAGRDGVLEALRSIAEPDHLRTLAREQQLGIASELATADDIRLAIVLAAERRLANRRAAGR